jgi:uncharacterized membrane protein YvbJ
MPRYRVRGEYIDVVLDASDEESALEQVANDEWGVILGNDLLHQYSSFSEDTQVEEVDDEEED